MCVTFFKKDKHSDFTNAQFHDASITFLKCIFLAISINYNKRYEVETLCTVLKKCFYMIYMIILFLYVSFATKNCYIFWTPKGICLTENYTNTLSVYVKIDLFK